MAIIHILVTTEITGTSGMIKMIKNIKLVGFWTK